MNIVGRCTNICWDVDCDITTRRSRMSQHSNLVCRAGPIRAASYISLYEVGLRTGPDGRIISGMGVVHEVSDEEEVAEHTLEDESSVGRLGGGHPLLRRLELACSSQPRPARRLATRHPHRAPAMALRLTLLLLALLVPLHSAGADTSNGNSEFGGPHLPTAYASERATLLSTRELETLVAVNRSRPAFPTVDVQCGSTLPRTRYTLHCVGGYPVGGLVLEPPQPPTRAAMWLHGLADEPTLYLTVLSLLLADAPADPWAGTRIVLPLAPVYKQLRFSPAPGQPLPSEDVYTWYDISPQFPLLLPGGAPGTTGTEVAASLASSPVGEDRLGLALSTARLVDLAAAQARGRLGAGLPPVSTSATAVFGHSLGGFMAWHLALRSGVGWSGVVAMSGGLPLAPLYARFAALRRAPSPRPAVTSLAADGDTIVAPLLSDGSAVTGAGLLGGGAVAHTLLRGSGHVSYLMGDPNTPRVRAALASALRGPPRDRCV